MRGNHLLKAGFDVRRQYVKSFFFPTIRGLLRYPTLNTFVNDVAEAANINKPLPGGDGGQLLPLVGPVLLRAGRLAGRLEPDVESRRPLRAAGQQHPEPDRPERADPAGEQQQPGLRAEPRTRRPTGTTSSRGSGSTGSRRRAATACSDDHGRRRFVMRGGYARTNDYAFLNIALNIASSFPYVAAINRSNLCERLYGAAGDAGWRAGRHEPEPADPDRRGRRFPVARLRPVQRRASAAAWPRTWRCGSGMSARSATTCSRRSTATRACRSAPQRQDPTRGVIRLRANTAESWYHSIQTQLDKRFSGGLSAGVHYTWSRFDDTASEVFNPSSGEVAVAQDSFNIDGDKGRATYDRPHRLTGNFVWELPWMRDAAGRRRQDRSAAGRSARSSRSRAARRSRC